MKNSFLLTSFLLIICGCSRGDGGTPFAFEKEALTNLTISVSKGESVDFESLEKAVDNWFSTEANQTAFF